MQQVRRVVDLDVLARHCQGGAGVTTRPPAVRGHKPNKSSADLLLDLRGTSTTTESAVSRHVYSPTSTIYSNKCFEYIQMRTLAAILLAGSAALAVRVGDVFETSIAVPHGVVDPFNFDEVLVQGTFSSPDGSTLVIDGFFFQNMTPSEPNSWDTLTPTGDPVYVVRYVPQVAGTHNFKLTCAVNGSSPTVVASGTIQAGPDPSFRGYIRVASSLSPPGSALHFAFSGDGSSYFAVGENAAWGAESDYERWWGNLVQAGGANYTRLWLGADSPFTLEDKAAGLGRYDQQAAFRLDTVLRLARRFGIRAMLSLNSFNRLRRTDPYPDWGNNPYTAVITEPSQYFTSGTCQAFFKRFLRYMVARYGMDPYVFCWEFWNGEPPRSPTRPHAPPFPSHPPVAEVDGVEEYDEDAVAIRHQAMGQYLRQLDTVAQHPRTTSFAQSPGSAKIDRLPEMDFVQTHSYGMCVRCAGGYDGGATWDARPYLV